MLSTPLVLVLSSSPGTMEFARMDHDLGIRPYGALVSNSSRHKKLEWRQFRSNSADLEAKSWYEAAVNAKSLSIAGYRKLSL